MLKIFLITGLVISISLIACKKESASDNMKGNWVERSQRLDTIEFVSFPDTKERLLNLKSVKGTNGLPKYAGGYYSMKIEQDSVILQWSVSSSISNKYYYFKFNNDKASFLIGNFYKHDIGDSILRFEKLK